MSGAKRHGMNSMWFRGIPFLVVICSLVAVWFGFYISVPQAHDAGDATDGILDLTGFDPDKQLIRISCEWDFYPDHLYSPDDFARNITEQPVFRSELENRDAIRTGTYRLVLHLHPNQYAEMTGYSIDYGTRVFANGNPVMTVGNVSSDPAKAVPSVNYMTFPIHADADGKVELVIQYSNFVHKEGGSLHEFMLASASLMEQYQSSIFLPVNLVAGALLFSAAYCLLKGFLRGDMQSVLLALCCIVFAFRDQRFYVVELLPNDYDWLFHYRIYIFIVSLMPAAVLSLMMQVFSRVSRWWMQAAVAAVEAATAILLFACSTQDSVLIMDVSRQIIIFGTAAYLIWLTRYFMTRRRMDSADILAIVSFGVLLLGMLIEELFVRTIPAVTRGGWTPLCMMAFVLLMLMTLSVREKQTEEELKQSREREQELNRLNQLNREFTRIIAHEINTPLTVASGYAQMLSRQVRRGEQSPDMADTLDVISSESRRLSTLVSQLLKMSKGVQIEPVKERVAVRKLLEDAASIAEPVLQKNDNALLLSCGQCPDISANRDGLLQVLLNLADNAGRHTRQGKVTFSAEPQEEFVIFRVADTGDGIAEKDAERIFTQGYSPDGRSGIGLAVSRDLVEAYGGTMKIESTGITGTTFCFTLPVWKEEQS